jgi:hypothetical protein
MSASPAATPVRTPLVDTAATDVFDDCQVAVLVTVCVPDALSAVAVSCADCPR